MERPDVIAHLKTYTAGRPVMTTQQLAAALNLNPKVVSRKRAAGCFEILHTIIGGKILYLVERVADVLIGNVPLATSGASKLEPAKADPIVTKRRRSNAELPDLSRAMLMRGFMFGVQESKDRIARLDIFMNALIAKEELEEALPHKRNGSAHKTGKL